MASAPRVARAGEGQADEPPRMWQRSRKRVWEVLCLFAAVGIASNQRPVDVESESQVSFLPTMAAGYSVLALNAQLSSLWCEIVHEGLGRLTRFGSRWTLDPLVVLRHLPSPKGLASRAGARPVLTGIASLNPHTSTRWPGRVSSFLLGSFQLPSKIRPG